MVRRLKLSSATGPDLDAVGRLLRELNLQYDDETPSAQVLANRVAELLGDGDTEVLLLGEPATGLAVLRLRKSIWTAHREAQLVEIHLEPEVRSREHERELVRAAMDVARDRGADFIEANAGASEVEMRALYEEFGFDAHEIGSDDSLSLHYSCPL